MIHPGAEVELAVEYFLEACPETEERSRRLYAGAIENGGLLATDFYTLRDWLEASGYQEHLSLHALLILLMVALDEGSLCLQLSEANCIRRLEALVSSEDAAHWAKHIMDDLGRHDYSRLIGASPDAGTPLVRQAVDGQSLLFFQKFLRHERILVEAFKQRLQPGIALPNQVSAGSLAAIFDEVLVRNPLAAGGKTLHLDNDQLTALGLVLSRPMVTVSGGPGTGKTSLVLTLLRCLTRCGIAPERIALAAPTGRAAQRLADSLRSGTQSLPMESASSDRSLGQIIPTTLHQLLGFMPSTGLFRRHPENPIPADVVILDEVSMVGLTMMGQLFHALAPRTRLVLLGDKDQLPSVEAGAVLSHLLPERFQPSFSRQVSDQLKSWFPSIPLEASAEKSLFDHQPLRDSVAFLRMNHRSEGRIQQTARAINERRKDVLTTLPRLDVEECRAEGNPWKARAEAGGCHLLPCTTGRESELKTVLRSWAQHAFLEAATQRGSYPQLVRRCVLDPQDEYDAETMATLRDLFTLLERSRLLTLVRDGTWGCVEINRFLERQLAELLQQPKKGSLFPGAPVLITQNDHVRRLSNGDVGLTLNGLNGGLRVVFSRGGAFTSFPAESLPAHELGFALTVHKSQGSEYDHVLLVFPPEGARRLLTRELVYTAVTRAKRLAVLFGKEDVIGQAIENQTEREAGWLRTLHGPISPT